MSILYSCQNDEDAVIENQIRHALPDQKIYRWPDCDYKSQVDMVIVWNPPPEFFSGLTNLKVIFSLAAGVDHVIHHPGLPEGVPIVRLEDAGMGDKMAEYVLYGVLHAQRNFGFYRESQQQEIWAHDAGTTHARDIHVSILGLGTLGTIVANRLLLNGYQVSGWSRRLKKFPGVQTYAEEAGLAQMLSTTHVLVCLLPLTDKTRHILNTSLFQQTPPGLFLINLARGAHLLDQDLLSALDNGQVKGALLDVTDPEPLPAKHAFWQHPQIILTPHIAGPTQEKETVQQITDNIQRFCRGQELTGVIDVANGY